MKRYKMNIIKKVFYRCRLLYLRRTNLLEYNKTMYYYTLGREINLKNPKSLDEKIIYMSFFTDTTLWSRCADKVAVRDYVKEHGFGYMLNEVYGVYERPQEIDYNKLPSGFVIKTNHASGTNIIVKNKQELDISKTNEQLEKWLKMDYSRVSGDPHYSSIKPLILIEKLLSDNSSYNTDTSLADFKFFCINGTPVAVEMMTDRFNHTHKRRFYDMDWNPHDEWMLEGYPVAEISEKPVPFEEMKQAAITLSKDFCFVRVDFYVINNKPVFGELTFTPGATECSQLFLEEQGAKLVLP